jgi:hypothetical protein
VISVVFLPISLITFLEASALRTKKEIAWIYAQPTTSNPMSVYLVKNKVWSVR